jgi:hypothetical protein
MSKIGSRIKCPKCGKESQVVWISKDRELVALRCTGYHSHITPPPTKFSKKIQTKTKKGIVFLIRMDKK